MPSFRHGFPEPLDRLSESRSQDGENSYSRLHTVVYVGRPINHPLGKRLYEHRLDRLSSRWKRFSWFGLLDVTEDGNLRESALNIPS